MSFFSDCRFCAVHTVMSLFSDSADFVLFTVLCDCADFVLFTELCLCSVTVQILCCSFQNLEHIMERFASGITVEDTSSAIRRVR